MENRARLRVQKKKAVKRSGKKVLVKKFLDYLKSDTYMYAPLLSPQPSVFPYPNAFKVVETKKAVKESKYYCLRGKVWEYLKSDVYMYNPLLQLPTLPPPPEVLKDYSRGGMTGRDVSRRATMNVNQHTNHLENVNELRSETESDHLPQTNISDHVTWRHKETVNHTVYQNCRPTLPSRNGTLNSQVR